MHDDYLMIESGWCGYCRGPLFGEPQKAAIEHLEVATFGVFMHSVMVDDSKKDGRVVWGMVGDA